MQNKPNFQKPEMNLTSYEHGDYEHESPLRTPPKQTQSNPILQRTGNPPTADSRRTSSELPAPPNKNQSKPNPFLQKSPQIPTKVPRFSHFFQKFLTFFSVFRVFLPPIGAFVHARLPENRASQPKIPKSVKTRAIRGSKNPSLSFLCALAPLRDSKSVLPIPFWIYYFVLRASTETPERTAQKIGSSG